MISALRALFFSLVLATIPGWVSAATAAPAQRIISCSLATDEIGLELLQRAHQEHRLIAVSRLADSSEYSNIAPVPPYLKARCGTELESIVTLKPDLILLAPYTKVEFVHQVNAAKIATFTTEKPDSIEKIEKSIEELGVRMGVEESARALLGDVRTKRARFRTIREGWKKRPRLLHMFGDGSFSGAGTMFDAIAQEIGAINVLAEKGIKGWPKLSLEQLVTLSPDLVVMAGSPADQAKTLKTLQGLPGVRDLKAVKEGRVILIPEKELGAVSHHVLRGVEQLSQAIKTIDQFK